MISSVIFDLNGTIVDDEPVHEVAFRGICSHHKVDLKHEDYQELCFGKSDRDGFESIVRKYKLARPDINELISKKREEYLRLIQGHVRAVPGVIEFISSLHGKFKLGVASGAVKKEIILILEYLNIKDFFSVIVSTDEVSMGKPNPAIYELALSKIGSVSAEALAIEDSMSGILSAKGAGLKCVGVTTTHSRSVLASVHPDLIIDSFAELNEKVIREL